MTGTANQIELADQIKSTANVEFDRVANVFRTVAQNSRNGNVPCAACRQPHAH